MEKVLEISVSENIHDTGLDKAPTAWQKMALQQTEKSAQKWKWQSEDRTHGFRENIYMLYTWQGENFSNV